MLDVVVGAIVFCCLGFALAAFIGNAEAAQPVVLAVFLPLSFISGIFIPLSSLPHWLADIGKVFPIYPFAAVLVAAYNPHTKGSGLSWGDLGLLAVWVSSGSSSPCAGSAGSRAVSEASRERTRGRPPCPSSPSKGQ